MEAVLQKAPRDWELMADEATHSGNLLIDTKKNALNDSYSSAKKRFSNLDKSLKYPSEYRTGNAHDEREKKAIKTAVSYLAPHSHTLDLPCGTGRLTRLLLDEGFKVRGADVSEGMVQMAAKNHKEYTERNSDAAHVDFDVVDIMRTGYKDKEFNAVVCNRLFHHFTESDTRVTALRELHRITSDVVVISFFNSNSFDACWRLFRNWMRRRHPKDRLPVSQKQFESELNSAGFQLVACISSRPYISPLCYAVARPVAFSDKTSSE